MVYSIGDIDSKMDEVLGYVNVELDGRFSAIRSRETNLGNMFTFLLHNPVEVKFGS